MEYLVIDVGGTAIKYACMNENAEFLERGEIPTPMDSLDSYLAALGTIIHRYGHNVEGIAMCVPGIIDSVQGVCITGGNLRYVKDLPLATLLEERYGLRVSLENDARCAALAELWRGSLKNCADGVVIVLGSAVGGALVKNGSIHKGSHFSSRRDQFYRKRWGHFRHLQLGRVSKWRSIAVQAGGATNGDSGGRAGRYTDLRDGESRGCWRAGSD